MNCLKEYLTRSIFFRAPLVKCHFEPHIQKQNHVVRVTLNMAIPLLGLHFFVYEERKRHSSTSTDRQKKSYIFNPQNWFWAGQKA